MKKYYLLPAATFATGESMQVSTILGSCVAVALFDPDKKICGLCHYLMARIENYPGPIARYGDQAIRLLNDEIIELGARPSSIIAKVYGGANVLGNVSIGLDISKKNIAIAHEVLDSLRIPIVKEDTGGLRGRRLLLSTDTFEIQQSFMENGGAPETSRFKARPLRALIIDTVPRTNKGFEDILTKSGLIITGTVADSFDAFHSITNQPPDIAVFRFYNQANRELQLIKDLKKMTVLPPFYIYSLGGSGLQAAQALELGASDFVHGESTLDLEALKVMAAQLVEKIWENSHVGKSRLISS